MPRCARPDPDLADTGLADLQRRQWLARSAYGLGVMAIGLASGLALPVSALAQSGALPGPQRRFPRNALRGELIVGDAWPEVLLNRQPARMALGARVRDASNRPRLPASLVGSRELVHYTLDNFGMLNRVWILHPDEAVRLPWPRTPAEAEAWSFDELAQVWVKPGG